MVSPETVLHGNICFGHRWVSEVEGDLMGEKDIGSAY